MRAQTRAQRLSARTCGLAHHAWPKVQLGRHKLKVSGGDACAQHEGDGQFLVGHHDLHGDAQHALRVQKADALGQDGRPWLEQDGDGEGLACLSVRRGGRGGGWAGALWRRGWAGRGWSGGPTHSWVWGRSEGSSKQGGTAPSPTLSLPAAHPAACCPQAQAHHPLKRSAAPPWTQHLAHAKMPALSAAASQRRREHLPLHLQHAHSHTSPAQTQSLGRIRSSRPHLRGWAPTPSWQCWPRCAPPAFHGTCGRP